MSNVFEEYNLTLQDAKARISALEAQVAEANRSYESCVKTLKFANDGWTETIGERDKWRRVAEGLARVLKEARVWAEWTDKHFDDIANTLAIDEALNTYNKAKAEASDDE